MALIECPDCARQVSDLAVACPQCGRPIAAADEAGAAVATRRLRPKQQKERVRPYNPEAKPRAATMLEAHIKSAREDVGPKRPCHRCGQDVRFDAFRGKIDDKDTCSECLGEQLWDEEENRNRWRRRLRMVLGVMAVVSVIAVLTTQLISTYNAPKSAAPAKRK